MKSTKLKWIGLFEVRPKASNPNVLDGAFGAFVNVLGLAEQSGCFVSLARDELSNSGFDVVSVDDVGLVSDRIQRDELIDELSLLADVLSDSRPIVFDEFQAYKQ